MGRIVKPYVLTASTLKSGEKIAIPPHAIKTEKHLSFTCNLHDIGEGKIIVGHGKDISSGSWLEITKDEVKAYAYYSYTDPQYRLLFNEPFMHGLKLYGFVTVVVDSNPCERITRMTLASADGMVSTVVKGWDGVDGEIFATCEGVCLENCKLNWFSDSFSRAIWLLGDSYSGISHGARWPFYLYEYGYNNCLISGFPGMPAEKAIEEFSRFVEVATPEFAVWTLGMNNADKNGVLSEGYLRSTKEFLRICAERGITPILSTIPNTPTVNNRQKNEWVRSSPYRYIDFARAVGSDENEGWYAEMLSADNVHPSKKGAEALYMQVLADFPEIMQRSNS